MCSNTFNCPENIPAVWSCTIVWRSSSSVTVYKLSSSRLHFCLLYTPPCSVLCMSASVCLLSGLGTISGMSQGVMFGVTLTVPAGLSSHFDVFTLLFVINCFDWCAIALSIARQNSLYCHRDTLENVKFLTIGQAHFKRACDINMVSSRFSESLPK